MDNKKLIEVLESISSNLSEIKNILDNNLNFVANSQSRIEDELKNVVNSLNDIDCSIKFHE